MVEIFKNDTVGTATDLGTLAFASNPSPDVVSSINFWEFDDVNGAGTGDPLDYYRFDPYQLASIRMDFTASTVGDYANYVLVFPIQGVARIEGDTLGVWTGGEHATSEFVGVGTSIIQGIFEAQNNAFPNIDTSAATWSRDDFPDSEAIWYLTGETVIFGVTGYEFTGSTAQIEANGNLPGEVDYRISVTPHVGDVPTVVLPEDTPDADNSPYEIYRFFNTLTGSHFFTASTFERDAIITNSPTITYEGNVFDSNATEANGGAAVYRFYNTITYTHFYTASAEEAESIRSNLPHMNDEGIAYYAHTTADSGGTPLYRFYNTSNSTHFFTASEAERDNIISTLGHYNYEGIAYYVDLA